MRDGECVEIKMRRGTLLVIFEYLARSYDEWRRTEKALADSSDDAFVLCKPDPGERAALWRLEGEIERTLPDIFNPDFKELVAAEKKRLSQELYGSGPQES